MAKVPSNMRVSSFCMTYLNRRMLNNYCPNIFYLFESFQRQENSSTRFVSENHQRSFDILRKAQYLGFMEMP